MRFLTDPRRNAGAHSIAIVEMTNELQSAYEMYYHKFSTILALLFVLGRQNPDSKISSENSSKSSKALSVEMMCLRRCLLTQEKPMLCCSPSEMFDDNHALKLNHNVIVYDLLGRRRAKRQSSHRPWLVAFS